MIDINDLEICERCHKVFKPVMIKDAYYFEGQMRPLNPDYCEDCKKELSKHIKEEK